MPAASRLPPAGDPVALFSLAIGIIGDVAAEVGRGGDCRAVLLRERVQLRFAAFFLDSHATGANDPALTTKCRLLAAAAYYLCDLPGSSLVLAKQIQIPWSESSDLDYGVLALLTNEPYNVDGFSNETFGPELNAAWSAFEQFMGKGDGSEALALASGALRKSVYRRGDAEELLLADVFFAVAMNRLSISSWVSLPQHTGLNIEAWRPAVSKPTFIREFWPSQRLLGEAGILKGASGVVQMPTSAGKTKATEIMLRSAFLSGRTQLAVIVAPFRALCHEIRDSLLHGFANENVSVTEVSDVPQADFIFEEIDKPQVLVLTPEKLLYVLRQDETLAPRIGLLVYDEGHQFDSGRRGVIYELLVTSLKQMVPDECQVVLISAVIPNAGVINAWLTSEKGTLVPGAALSPTLRSIAYASWQEETGRLEYPGDPDAGNFAYSVPSIIESVPLKKLGLREKPRVFPIRGDDQTVALYLALKFVPLGGVAIFCGNKASVSTLCEILTEAYARGLNMAEPVAASNADETGRIHFLVEKHLGAKSAISACAKIGVFTHHGSTPAGIRLSVEHAMKTSLIKFVICTSTLAQGVNLPIKYLFITGVYQGGKLIKVRDFHNLMGRAGRSGMHTEGSVIFADPELYASKGVYGADWRWQLVQGLLDPTKAEECASSLLTLFAPLLNDRDSPCGELDAIWLFDALRVGGDSEVILAASLAKEHRRELSPGVALAQVIERARLFDALESFLLSRLGAAVEIDAEAITELARETLAYHLASDAQKKEIEALFVRIATHVAEAVPDINRRISYSKSLLGILESERVRSWVVENRHKLEAASTDDEQVELLWPLLAAISRNGNAEKCTKPEALLGLVRDWIGGKSEGEILEALTGGDVKFGLGKRPRKAGLDHVADLCENLLGYDSVLVFSAIIEELRQYGAEHGDLIEGIEVLQKRFKYGLASEYAVALHEMGFADRIVAAELAVELKLYSTKRSRIRSILERSWKKVDKFLSKYPSYFMFVYENITR